MKNNNNLVYGLLTASGVMTLTRLPYPIVAIAFSVIIMLTLYCIIKYNVKFGWGFLGIAISIFIGYICFFISRTMEEFAFGKFIEKTIFFIGVFFMLMTLVFGYILIRPHIKKMGGFANMMEDQNPGSWDIMKFCFWFVIAFLIFAVGIIVWDNFFK